MRDCEMTDALVRVQVAMWVDGDANCFVCKKVYVSVDDFLARNPRAGYGFKTGGPDRFIDDGCFDQYAPEDLTGPTDPGEPR